MEVFVLLRYTENMKRILLIGSGKIGAMITHMLAGSGDYHVTIADFSDVALAKVPQQRNVSTLKLDVSDETALMAALDGKFAVLSAVPFQVTKYIARAAVAAKVHYFDLTEDVENTRMVKELAVNASSALMPQCGLAPGFISIVAHHLTKGFDELDEVRMRVGALTQFPTNVLKYNLTWSTDGLINEYIKPCEAVVDGKIKEVPALDGYETFALDGTDYEAFNTSGGLGTLCETLSGRVNHLNYKSVRYPGHCDILKLLIKDLRLGERPGLLKEIFENALPLTYQDVVLVFASVTGRKDGVLMQETYAHKIYSHEENAYRWSAIQITTASGICGVLDLLAHGKLPQHGFIRQEDVDFDDFITNRFGQNYERRQEVREP